MFSRYGLPPTPSCRQHNPSQRDTFLPIGFDAIRNEHERRLEAAPGVRPGALLPLPGFPRRETGMANKGDGGSIGKRQYEALATFRYQLRLYLRYSEEMTRRHGITPLQYQLLLHVKGFPGREHASVTELAERLQAKHHGVVALVTRSETAGLVKRKVSDTDRRLVHVYLTPKGEQKLARLADLHRRELLQLQGRFFVPDAETLRGD